MNILALDTATSVCTVALSSGGQVATRHIDCPREHTRWLLPYVDAVLNEVGISVSDLDLICCGVGPGSFMGVRLAAGVAQGLSYASSVPLLPISTLRIVAQSYQGENALGLPIAAAWDARMGEIYCGLYQADADGVMQGVQPDQLVKPEALSLPGEVVAVGNAWQVYDASISTVTKSLCAETLSDCVPQAEAMITIGVAADPSLYVRAADLRVTYLRQAVSSS